MKRNYHSGAQKRQAKRRKIAKAARKSQRLSSWLTRRETSKADQQNVSIRETGFTPKLIDVSGVSTVSTRVPTKKTPILLKINHMQAGMTTFPPLLQSQRSKKQLLQQVPNNLRTFP